VKREGNTIVIGALTKHYEVATSAVIKAAIPALAWMASTIGDTQVRNRGTMGGSIANNDPSADYPAALLALGATIQTDRRKISADDFFQGMFATALDAGEIVTAIHIPVPDKAGYAKMKNPASRYSMAGVFVAKGSAGVRVAVNGAGANGTFRATAMEAALAANWSADAVAGIKLDAGKMNGDIHGSAEYRAHLVGVSMGGMIAQLLAAQHPQRVASLTSIMSSTGNPDPRVAFGRPRAIRAILRSRTCRP
jgi:carbon-monoxide dehydrogenase medium subunit